MPGRFEVRATDDASTPVGEATVASVHRDLLRAAVAFTKDEAPFKTIIHVADCGEPRFLTDKEDEFVDAVADKLGVDVNRPA